MVRKTSPRRVKRKTSPRRVKRKTSPRRVKRKTSPRRVKRKTSPRRVKRRTSPRRVKRRTSPRRRMNIVEGSEEEISRLLDQDRQRVEERQQRRREEERQQRRREERELVRESMIGVEKSRLNDELGTRYGKVSETRLRGIEDLHSQEVLDTQRLMIQCMHLTEELKRAKKKYRQVKSPVNTLVLMNAFNALRDFKDECYKIRSKGYTVKALEKLFEEEKELLKKLEDEGGY